MTATRKTSAIMTAGDKRTLRADLKAQIKDLDRTIKSASKEKGKLEARLLALV